MDVTITILAVIILVGVLLVVRRGRSGSNERPRQRPSILRRSTSQFHAVSIKYGSRSCEAAKAMEGKRFLSSAAPKLPLPDCDVLECKCRFVHHKDRRAGDDRRNPWRPNIGGDTGTHPKEKRHRGERRADGSPDDFFK